jgi:hypothetical protein
MHTIAASSYREEVLGSQNIDELSERLTEDYAEVEEYRSEDCRVWVALDHVEAIAVDKGKLCRWRFKNGTHYELREALMRRFSGAESE